MAEGRELPSLLQPATGETELQQVPRIVEEDMTGSDCSFNNGYNNGSQAIPASQVTYNSSSASSTSYLHVSRPLSPKTPPRDRTPQTPRGGTPDVAGLSQGDVFPGPIASEHEASPEVVKEAPILSGEWKSLESQRKNTKFGAVTSSFSGPWEECNTTRKVHLINETELSWASGAISELLFIGDTMQMIEQGTFKGTSAQLSDTSDKLQWSDGDVWKKAGLNGLWKDRASGGIHSVLDERVSTLLRSGLKEVENVTILTTTLLSITLNGVTSTATLDKAAMSLTWSDGDIWDRAHTAKFHWEV